MNPIMPYVWMAIVLLMSTAVGVLAGHNRSKFKRSSMGVITFTIITTAATAATLSVRVLDKGMAGDPWRYSSAIIQGVGFLGAGILWKKQDSEDVKGLTTAAMLFANVIIGSVLGNAIHANKFPDAPEWMMINPYVIFIVAFTIMIYFIMFRLRSLYYSKKLNVSEKVLSSDSHNGM